MRHVPPLTGAPLRHVCPPLAGAPLCRWGANYFRRNIVPAFCMDDTPLPISRIIWWRHFSHCCRLSHSVARYGRRSTPPVNSSSFCCRNRDRIDLGRGKSNTGENMNVSDDGDWHSGRRKSGDGLKVRTGSSGIGVHRRPHAHMVLKTRGTSLNCRGHEAGVKGQYQGQKQHMQDRDKGRG